MAACVQQKHTESIRIVQYFGSLVSRAASHDATRMQPLKCCGEAAPRWFLGKPCHALIARLLTPIQCKKTLRNVGVHALLPCEALLTHHREVLGVCIREWNGSFTRSLNPQQTGDADSFACVPCTASLLREIRMSSAQDFRRNYKTAFVGWIAVLLLGARANRNKRGAAPVVVAEDLAHTLKSQGKWRLS
eukprot:1070878-Amphidinium_carterae.1